MIHHRSVELVAAGARRRFGIAALTIGLAFGGALVAVPAAAQNLPDFTGLVEQVGPAVVGIRTTERVKSARNGPGIDEDMQEFLRRFGIPVPNPRAMPPGANPKAPQQPDAEQQTRGIASGLILTSDGYVLTNAHVVDGADEVLVTLTDSRELKARIIGADKRSDVALLKLDATGLPAVRVGDSERTKVGEWVIAIGSPFGLESTVTAGIVSAKSRDTGDLIKLIQTDVAINPGNSGGPLINMRGEVIGINSQIYSRSGGYMGISFAIPIDEAIRVSDSLKANGRVIRGRVGVAIGPVTREVADSIGLGKPIGAVVSSVEAGGPAEKAGVEAGDIITKVDGKSVEKFGDLPRMVGMTKPGTRSVLQVFRRGAYRDVNVTVAELEPERNADATNPGSPEPKAPAAVVGHLGIGAADLTDAQRGELKIKGGVRVLSVDGPAAKAGLRVGDVVLSVNNVEVASAKQFDAAVAKLNKSKTATVLVRRGDSANFLVIRPGP